MDLNLCMHPHTHTQAHTCIHAHTYMHTCTHAPTHAYSHAHTAMIQNYICPPSAVLNKRAEETANTLPEPSAHPPYTPFWAERHTHGRHAAIHPPKAHELGDRRPQKALVNICLLPSLCSSKSPLSPHCFSASYIIAL